jgi:hypothetical protein
LKYGHKPCNENKTNEPVQLIRTIRSLINNIFDQVLYISASPDKILHIFVNALQILTALPNQTIVNPIYRISLNFVLRHVITVLITNVDSSEAPLSEGTVEIGPTDDA